MRDDSVERVAVVGVGLMGLGIGLEFARFGYEVGLYDTRENFGEVALREARADLDLMVSAGLIAAGDAGAAIDRMHPTGDLETAVKGAGYVVEAVFDKLALKQEIFARLDELCPPPAILATNTTSLRVTDIAASVKHPERILTTHYFQPPHFMPLVEVVGGEKTAPEAIERAVKVLRGLRKKVVVLKQDVNTLVGTRIQSALDTRAQEIMDMGLADSFQDVDDIIAYGFGRRLAYTANFKRLDLIGLDFLYTTLTESGKPVWGRLVEKVQRGELGMKSGKGFYEWSDEAAARENLRLKKGLIQLMKQDMEAGNI